MSFQNLDGVRKNLLTLFGLDLAAGLTNDEWKAAIREYQRRHVLSHRAGVVDQEYIDKSGDRTAIAGRKIIISENEVRDLVAIIRKAAHYIYGCLGGNPRI